MFESTPFTRRRFIRGSLQLTAAILLADPLKCLASRDRVHRMSFYHTHTEEHLTIDYSCNGCREDTLNDLNHFLRDFRTEDIHIIDPGLLDILYGIQQKTGSKGVIEVISGYRSPKTNQMLRAKSNGVAKKSLHLKGQALDFRIAGYRTKKLRDIAISLQQGGVGYYAKSNFIHIDTGRVRTW